jgi:hypothetical protein
MHTGLSPVCNIPMIDVLDQPSIAVLIDCWEHDDTNSIELYKNIVSVLNELDSIKTVVLSSYHRKKKKELNSIWHHNRNDYFCKKYKNCKKIQDLSEVHRYFEDKKFTNKHCITDNSILNYINADKLQIAMHWRWELDLYLSNNPDISNIYVFGSAWEECIKTRPLGYDSLSEIKDINILTNITCVSDLNGNTPAPNEEWDPITNLFYKLKND